MFYFAIQSDRVVFVLCCRSGVIVALIKKGECARAKSGRNTQSGERNTRRRKCQMCVMGKGGANNIVNRALVVCPGGGNCVPNIRIFVQPFRFHVCLM